jgi:hypothetical protein
MLERRIDADHLSVGFSVNQARKSIKRRATHASTAVQGFSVSLVKRMPKGRGNG